MASQNLDISIKLTTDLPLNGIFCLESISADVLEFNNGAVTGNTISVTTGAAVDVVAASVSKQTYVFVKNTDPTNFVFLKTAAGTTYGKLLPGEFNFISVYPSVGLEVLADTADCVVEYATFEKP